MFALTLHRSHAWPVRVYDCSRFLTTVEKLSRRRSSRGSFILPETCPALDVAPTGLSSPQLLSSLSTGRLEAGRPDMAGL